MDDRKYDFFAFISYKREDEKWAKWLQRKLEYYKLPSSVRKDNPDLPEKIRPVFKDTTDLEPGVLARKIQDALDSSKYLIVICSPRSANSVWVSKEVQAFIDSGRSDHIIPFIIGGIPNASDPKDECFPEGLRQLAGEQELLGANINEMGREAAAIKVVARMFNLRFDTLWQRYEKYRKRKRYIVSFLLFIIVSVALLIASIIAKQNVMLERANGQLEEANNAIILQRDSIQKVKNDLSSAYDSILMSKKNLMIAQDSLKKTNIALLQTNNNLNIANRDLQAEKQIVIAKEAEITKGYISLLITSANEQYSRNEFLLSSKTMSQAIDLIKENEIKDSELLAYYEKTLRLIERKWDEPGLNIINSITIPESMFGAFDNDEILFTQGKSMKGWSFLSTSEHSSSVRTLSDMYLMKMLEKLNYSREGMYIEHKDSDLRIVNSLNGQIVGKPLEIGSRWLNLKYKYGADDKCIIISRDSVISRYYYITGKLDTIAKFKSTVSDFSQSPTNKNVLSVVTADSCVSMINCSTKKIYRSKKFDQMISSVSFHPNGNYLAIAGNDLSLTNSALDILANVESKEFGGYGFAMFNDGGDKLYGYSLSGKHTVWSVGYAPYDYSLLSNSAKYGVIYKNKAYRVYDYSARAFIPDFFIKDENETYTCFGNKDSNILVSKWDTKSKCYTFYIQSLDKPQKRTVLSGMRSKDKKEALINDYRGIAYVASKDTLNGFDISQNKLYQYGGIKVKKIMYSAQIDSLLILSESGELLKASNDLSVIEVIPGNISEVICFDMDNHGNIYISDSKGYLYYFDIKTFSKHYIGIADNVSDISVDKSGIYLMVHNSYSPKVEFNIHTMPYGYNTISNTKIWDVHKCQVIDDLSSYKLSNARLFRDFCGDVLIDAGHFWLPLINLKTLENRTKSRFE